MSGAVTAVAVAVGLMAAGTPVASAAVTTTERLTLPASGSITVAGRGYGHGRGMSQYGARAAAAAGVGYQSILDFYYPGTRSVTQSNAQIRVRLLADTDNNLRVVAVPGMTASDASHANTPISLPGKTVTQWRVTRTSAGFVLHGLVAGSWVLWSTGGASAGYLSLAAPSGTLRLVLPNGTQKEYRGTLRGVPNGASAQSSVNSVAMEDYLRSVVPAESPSSWPTDALRAQAVAARTYASYERASNPNGAWQTCDTTQCQVYAGYRSYSAAGSLTTTHEAASSNAAIIATANQVRHYNGSLAFTQFGSSNGGWTAPGTLPYQVAKADPWDGIGNPVHAWTVTLTTQQLRNAYPQVGTPRSIEVRTRSGYGEWGGRTNQVVITGSAGTATTTGTAFRSTFGLRSDWWKITASSRLESDFTANGRPDILAQTTTGSLRAYEGNGAGGFGAMTTIGQGWGSMRLVVRANDLTGDGRADILAVDAAGSLWRYPSNGAGGFGARVAVGQGWGAMRQLVAPGDLNNDGKADLLAVDASGGMWRYLGTGTGGFSVKTFVGPGWGSMTAVLGGGDWNDDGLADFLARDAAGRLYLYRGSGALSFTGTQIGTGWGGMRLLGAMSDWNGDGRPDLLASSSTGALYLYPWTGSGFGSRQTIGTGWTSIARLL